MKTCSVLLTSLLVVLSAYADEDRLGESLGTIQFESGGKPEVREHIVRGVKLLHHMMYPEADREFARAADLDPDCAFAWWGRAMVLIHPLWPDVPTEEDRQTGAGFLTRGLATARATPRERAYLETLNTYFGGVDNLDYPTRIQALDRAWVALADKYPDDLDAQAFCALYRLAPIRFLPKDRSYRLQFDAAARLQAILAKIPDHPGGQHYKIHAYDYPLIADHALEVCDTYSATAPDVPHALHMPTHIYTRRGLWEKSIEFNQRSAEAALKLTQINGTLNSHYPHALDYLAYAYLQVGKYHEAEAIRDRLSALVGPYSPVQRPAMAFAFAAIPARCALERQDWRAAAALPLHQPGAFPWGPLFLNCDSIVQFARALGAARSGNLDQARTEIANLERTHATLAASKAPRYWPAQAEAQLLTARAWVRWAEQANDEALALMRQAVEVEAGTDKEAVTPGEVLPAGDLLGDLLLELKRPAEALAAYENVLAGSPNRLNTLYGAGVAAERAGDALKARKYFGQLAQTAVAADPALERLEHARAYLAQPAVAVLH